MHSTPRPAIIDWTPHGLRRAAKKVQMRLHRQLTARSPVPLPLFAVVQQKLLPSQREIAEGLCRGAYQEYLK